VKTGNRYTAAISELEAAREAASDAASLCVWIAGGGDPVADAASDPLSGRLGLDASGRGAMSFSAVLAELRADAEHLTAHPVEHDQPPGRVAWELIRRPAS
jgi:hypothetical protein